MLVVATVLVNFTELPAQNPDSRMTMTTTYLLIGSLACSAAHLPLRTTRFQFDVANIFEFWQDQMKFLSHSRLIKRTA